MLEGVVPFPPEFAKLYREKGYWIDKTLEQEYRIAYDKYEKRVALLDRDRSITVSYTHLTLPTNREV